MSITYTYQITAVNESAKCMEVVYSADGLTTYTVGTRLPFKDEPVESVIEMFAPLAMWVQETTPVYAPVVGTQGVIETSEPQQPELVAAANQPTTTGAQTL